MRKEPSFVHPAATVPDSCTIGRFAVIEEGAILGEGVTIGDHALVATGAQVGARTVVGTYCLVGPGAVIGEDCRFTAYCEIRAHCEVGDRVSMGSRCTLSAGTIVGDDVVVKYGFVATDTPVLSENDQKATCVLGTGSRYGANVTIMPAVTVGENSEIGACSQVRHNVPANQVWYGNPASYYRDV